jgi:hypothetical protein
MSMGRMSIGTVFLTLLMACHGKTESPAVDSLGLREIALNGCPVPEGAPRRVALSDLMSHPDRYNGAFVSVAGYYYSDFERSVLFAGPEERPYIRGADEGIWLLRMDKSLAGKKVQVSGVFTTEIKGHLRQWPGSICVTHKSKI